MFSVLVFTSAELGKCAFFFFNCTLAALQKEMAQHKGSLKGGAFRLNMHPQSFFDGNPFRMDKPLPPVRKTTSAGPKDLKPFKPSSPGKKVCISQWLCVPLAAKG